MKILLSVVVEQDVANASAFESTSLPYSLRTRDPELAVYTLSRQVSLGNPIR